MAGSNGQTAKDAYLADLRGQRDRLNALIAAVESEGEGLPVEGGAVGPTRQGDSQVRPDSFFAMTTPQATRKYLEMMGPGNPQTPMAIVEALIRGGMDKPENRSAVVKNVYTALTRGQDREFIRIQKEWGLSDWYSDRKLLEEKPTKRKRKRGRASRRSRVQHGPVEPEKPRNPFAAFNEYRKKQLALGKSQMEIREEWNKRKGA